MNYEEEDDESTVPLLLKNTTSGTVEGYNNYCSETRRRWSPIALAASSSENHIKFAESDTLNLVINGAKVKMDDSKENLQDQDDSSIIRHTLHNTNSSSSSNCINVLKSFTISFYQLFIPSSTFLKFFIAALIPAIADQIIPLFFTGQIPNESALAISGQFIFISIIIEVIQEGIVNSIFYYIGKNYETHRAQSLQGLKICMSLVFVIGTLFTIVIVLLNSQFVKFIDTPSNLVEATKLFLWTSSFSFPLMLVSAVISNYLYITTSSLLICSQLVQVICSFLTNFFLFGQQSLSLHWGIEQLGYFKIIQSGINCSINLVFLLIIEKMSPFHFLFHVPFVANLKSNFKTLFKVSWGNFGDSAVRNFFYFMVTLKFINNLGETEIGAWNLLNSLIWGLLLIPSYTTANYIKVRIGLVAKSERLREHIKEIGKGAFVSLTVWLLLLSIASSILWPNLASYFSQSNAKVQDMSGEMFFKVGWIFIIFSYNNAMDSLFFGTGRTEYIFYQSIGTNMIVYFIPWILYLANVLTPTLWWVLGLYIGGMLVDFCLTISFCVQLWKQIPISGSGSTSVEV